MSSGGVLDFVMSGAVSGDCVLCAQPAKHSGCGAKPPPEPLPSPFVPSDASPLPPSPSSPPPKQLSPHHSPHRPLFLQQQALRAKNLHSASVLSLPLSQLLAASATLVTTALRRFGERCDLVFEFEGGELAAEPVVMREIATSAVQSVAATVVAGCELERCWITILPARRVLATSEVIVESASRLSARFALCQGGGTGRSQKSTFSAHLSSAGRRIVLSSKRLQDRFLALETLRKVPGFSLHGKSAPLIGRYSLVVYEGVSPELALIVFADYQPLSLTPERLQVVDVHLNGEGE